MQNVLFITFIVAFNFGGGIASYSDRVFALALIAVLIGFAFCAAFSAVVDVAALGIYADASAQFFV